MTVQLSRDGVQRLLSLFGRFSLFFILFISSLDAQTFKEFKNTPVSSFVVSDFFFKQSWNSYESLEAKQLYQSKKPKKISSVAKTSIKDVGPKIRIVPPEIKKYPSLDFNGDGKYKIDFFSMKISFDIPDDIKEAKFYPQSQNGIENFFSIASSSDYNFLIMDIKKVSKDLNLNDWGLYLLVTKLSDAIFLERDNSNLFTWFVFNQLGYDVKASVIKRHVALLFASKQIVYDLPNYTINGIDYYVIDKSAEVGSAYTYDINYPNANNSFDFSLKELPFLPQDIKEKDLRFVLDDNEHIIKYRYNQNIIDFMATYPNVQSDVFFEAPLDNIAELTLSKSFKELLDTKRSSSGINFILYFVQKAFKYQSDEEQFGRQKSMFAEETLYYKNSDSEDRVALFITLVKKLFGFNAIGVRYKDHTSSALYIPLAGDSVDVGKRRYVLADPTYENANLGEAVPKYKDEIPKEFIILR